MAELNRTSDNGIFLATTALEEFWDTTKPVVFLGEWCCRYGRRMAWEPLKGEILPGIWKDRKTFVAAHTYLRNVYESLLRQMAALLDEVHGEHHEVRYWRTILGPWLFHYVDVLYDHYLCIEAARRSHPHFDTIGLDEGSFITPLTSSEYYLLSQDDPYNLQIYSRILSSEGACFRRKPCRIVGREHFDRPARRNFSAIFKDHLMALHSRLVAMTAGGKSILLLNPYFSMASMLRLFLKSKGTVKPVFPRHDKLERVAPDMGLRRPFERVSLGDNAFEKLVPGLLPLDIPLVFLESYEITKKKAARYPRKPKAIVSAVSWYFDEVFKIWAAKAAEQGSHLCGLQHGGNYGIDQYMQALDHEVAVTDKYYSWGWTYPEFKDKVVPMPANKMMGMEKVIPDARNTKILFTATAYSRYFYRLDYPNNKHFEKYYHDQLAFFQSLGSVHQQHLRYRAFMHDYGLDIVKRIQDACPDLILEGSAIPFRTSLRDTRILVCDHFSTVHAEAFSLNVPTIIFLDPDIYIHRKEAHEYLDHLRAAGVLHYTPESAACTVSDIYDHVDDWWNEEERQSAIAEYRNRYARSSPHAIDEWIGEFNKIGG